jgi:hypothetical protein
MLVSVMPRVGSGAGPEHCSSSADTSIGVQVAGAVAVEYDRVTVFSPPGPVAAGDLVVSLLHAVARTSADTSGRRIRFPIFIPDDPLV